ncbi:unnamed protein product [Ixodes pacificus]
MPALSRFPLDVCLVFEKSAQGALRNLVRLGDTRLLFSLLYQPNDFQFRCERQRHPFLYAGSGSHHDRDSGEDNDPAKCGQRVARTWGLATPQCPTWRFRH